MKKTEDETVKVVYGFVVNQYPFAYSLRGFSLCALCDTQ
jgi:hypothetical protein